MRTTADKLREAEAEIVALKCKKDALVARIEQEQRDSEMAHSRAESWKARAMRLRTALRDIEIQLQHATTNTAGTALEIARRALAESGG